MNKMKGTIFVSVLVSYLGISIIMPIMAPLARELGLAESQAGWMISTGSIAMAIMAPIWGKWSDRIGRRSIMLIGLAGMALSFGLYTFFFYLGLENKVSTALVFILLIMGRVLVGVFLTAVPTSAQALMADTTDEAGRSSGMALISAANGIGLVFGPAIGGALVLIGLIWPLYAAIVLPVVAFAIVWAAVPRMAARPRSTAARLKLSDRRLRPWLLVGLVTMLSIITLQSVGGFYLQDRLGLTAEETARVLAVALTISGAALAFTQFMQMAKLKWQPHTLLVAGLPMIAISLLLLLFTASAISYYGAFLLFGLGVGCVMPAYMSGASLAVDRERQGAIAGVLAMLQGIGAVIAPIGSTYLYEWHHSSPFWVITALVSLTFIGTLRLHRHLSVEHSG